MPRTVNHIRKHLSPGLQKKVEARAGDRASVATGYLGLANRRLRGPTQPCGVERMSLEQQLLERNPSESSGGSVTNSNLPKPRSA